MGNRLARRWVAVAVTIPIVSLAAVQIPGAAVLLAFPATRQHWGLIVLGGLALGLAAAFVFEMWFWFTAKPNQDTAMFG